MFVDPQVSGFVSFCIGRRGRDWPALYDEMLTVSRGRLYHGLHYDELRGLGLSLGLNGLDETKSIVDVVIDQLDNGTNDDKPDS
jgi:hypothetical protein